MNVGVNTSVLELVRGDLRDFAGYRSARRESVSGGANGAGMVWLNANESAWNNAGVPGAALRRYPDPQPAALREALAGLYGVMPAQVLAGRGSDEGIDLLVRAFCHPGGDAIVTTTPTFGMYAVCARLHGVRVVDVPLMDGGDGLDCDFDAVAEACGREEARIVFLCSPGNPSGTLLPLDRIDRLASELRGRAVVVVDEAYAEYAQAASATTLLATHDNIVVLRTLSKAHALAAARIGVVVASPGLIEVLQRCQAPYPLPAPCVDAALSALSPPALAVTADRVRTSIDERQTLHAALRAVSGVRHVYPSRANFLLVRFDAAETAFRDLLDAGVVVRDMRVARGLDDALRISIGTPEQNALVLDALKRRTAGTQVVNA